MKPFGIYTLANDVVLDQAIALINSIEANVNIEIPICIIPFDDCLEHLRAEIETRPNVSILDNSESIERWESFARQFATAHPFAQSIQLSHPRWYNGKLHRKFAAFDGEFEKFIFFDADSLAMKPVDDVWKKLEHFDFVFNDWEPAKPQPHTALDIPLIQQTTGLAPDYLQSQLHCSSFWGSKQGLLGPEVLADMVSCFQEQGEAAWVNAQGWWDDAFLFNYMTLHEVLRNGREIFNFTLSSDGRDRVGNCANADPFVPFNNVLYNEKGLKPIHRIHYMGYSSGEFKRLSQGEDVGIPHQDIFLHYRFLQALDQLPIELRPPSVLTKSSHLFQRTRNKLTTRLRKLMGSTRFCFTNVATNPGNP